MLNESKRGRVFQFFLPVLLSGIVMLVQAAVYALIVVSLILMHRWSWIDLYQLPQIFPLTLAGASLAIGAVFSVFLLRFPLKPLKELMDASDRISEGDYSVRVRPQGLSEFRELGERFNHMAEELQSVELLRGDFINSFSHEFKTPIVSIRGFAKMLKSPDLSEAEREEYLDIIIEESERLSELSTNVLAMSNLEKQSILTDRRPYNLSEQIRLCIAMMDAKWSKKQIDYVLTGRDVTVLGSEELLKQVWINLLDNAIKFSPEKGSVTIRAAQSETETVISVRNDGEPIPAEALPHLFDKFYQGDFSHATKGNGLGLTIAKRIVELHNGTIEAASDETGNIFTVRLPSENR